LEVEIRRIAANDAALFDHVAAEVFDEDIDPARLAAYLAEPRHLMIVALAGGEIVGQTAAVIHRHPDKPTELYLDEVGVTPALWRRGIARRMLQAMFAWGVELGCEEAWVGTEPDNHPARGLYEAFGETAVPIVMYEYDPLPGPARRS
jgi:ribosomal protein S18 acetylase RimI-like enzyme